MFGRKKTEKTKEKTQPVKGKKSRIAGFNPSVLLFIVAFAGAFMGYIAGLSVGRASVALPALQTTVDEISGRCMPKEQDKAAAEKLSAEIEKTAEPKQKSAAEEMLSGTEEQTEEEEQQ